MITKNSFRSLWSYAMANTGSRIPLVQQSRTTFPSLVSLVWLPKSLHSALPGAPFSLFLNYNNHKPASDAPLGGIDLVWRPRCLQQHAAVKR